MEIGLKELLEIDGRKHYWIRFCCSNFGRCQSYDNLEDAEKERKRIEDKHWAHGDFAAPPHICEISGWEEELTEENMMEYMTAAMRIINHLKCDIESAGYVVKDNGEVCHPH